MTQASETPLSFPGLEELFALYDEEAEQIAHFKEVTRIDCPKGCQKCCETARFVEASSFEMLPLSMHLWQTGKAESILMKLEKVDPERPCILWEPDPVRFSEGGCRYYPYRPLVCRLFGFSSLPDKYGNSRIALCKPLKELNPGMEDRLNQMIQKGLRVPSIPDESRRAVLLHPYLGLARESINVSLRRALEMVGQRIQFMNQANDL